MNAYYNPVPAIQGKGSTAKIPQLVKEILPEGGSVLLLAWGSPVFFYGTISGADGSE